MSEQTPKPSKRWEFPKPITPQVEQELAQYSPIMRKILFNRDITTNEAAQRYIQALPPEENDPRKIMNIPLAVDLICNALEKDTPIVIYGDYDVDGVTATALLTQVLKSLGAKVHGYIPNRFDEGYGLNIEALDSIYDEGARLVITVDCGIRSPLEVAHAQKRGLDMIITDHHHPGETLPPAAAVVDLKQKGESYPDKDLSGVGIAYKLASALVMSIKTREFSQRQIPPMTDYLDLVALGTVADVSPMQGENRHLVRQGLMHLTRPHRQGIQSLMGVTGLTGKRINAEHIGFILGPRLNAAGRLDSAMAALNLLMTQDVQQAAYLAQVLDVQNTERQKITKKIQEMAEELALSKEPEAPLLFAAHQDFNAGVVGLAASRLTDKFYRPAIVAHQDDEFTRASCRSIPELHITDVLDQCADLLLQHGGHAAAAGFTVRTKDLPELEQRLFSIVREKLKDTDLRPSLQADAEVNLVELRPELLKELDSMQPTGSGNPPATFVSRGLKVLHSRTVGRENTHLKLAVSDGHITYDAIAFRQGHWRANMPTHIDIIYQFELNEYNGRKMLQLNVSDLKPAGQPDR